MTLHKKKSDPLGTTRITGKDLEQKYASDPEGRFEINTAWGYKEVLKGSIVEGRPYWYMTGFAQGEGFFTQEEIEAIPEILYTHSAFLSEVE